MSVVSSSKLHTNGKVLQRAVVRLETRLAVMEAAHRRNRVQRALADQVFWGLLLGTMLLAAGHFVRALHHPIVVCTTVVVCASVVVVRAWGRRRDVLQLAMWVDARAGLDDRVSSAIAFLPQAAADPMMEEAIVDAEARLEGVDEESISGGPPSQRWYAVPALLLILPVLSLIPPRLTLGELAGLRAQRAIAGAGTELAKAAESLEEHLSADASAAASQAVQETGAAGRDLESGAAATPQAAMERVQQAGRQVDQTLREDTQRELLAERLQRNTATRAAGEALAQGDTQAAADALRSSADALSQQDVGGQAGRQLADDLRHAGQAVPPGEARAAANRAAAGAEAGRLDAAQQGLQELARDVERMTALEQDRAVVEQASEALREARDTVGGAPQSANEESLGGRETTGADGQDEQGSEARPGEPDTAASTSAPEGPAEGGERGAGAGAGSASPELGAGQNIAEMESGVRVTVAGQLMQGERRAGTGTGGPRVDEDETPDLVNVVQQFREVGEAEIARQEIPPAYRALVRDYFTALEDVAGRPPGAGRAGQQDNE